MKAFMCVGNYADRPCSFDDLGIKVYCAEELCYVLKENAFLLDTDMISENLISWLEKECALPDLADELRTLAYKKGSFSAFICRILEYVGFYDGETIRGVEQTLKKGAGLGSLEKRKLRVDYLLEQKKYETAVSEYDTLLALWRDSDPRFASDLAQMSQNGTASGLQAAILHNKGTALARLMRYEDAADSYQAAYVVGERRESLMCFLAAKRMELSDHEYVELLSSSPEYMNASMELEGKVEEINTKWEDEPDNMRLKERRTLRGEDIEAYLNENERICEVLREDYRRMV